MDVVLLSRLREKLARIKEAQALTAPAIIVHQVQPTGRKKKKLTPEAIEAFKGLQETPPDIWSGQAGPGAALRSSAIGGAVGGGLGFTVGGLTSGGQRVPMFSGEKTLKELAAGVAKMPEKERQLAKLLKSQRVRRLAGVGAGAGLASSLYYQHRRKKLKEKLEEELANKKKTKTGSVLMTAGNIMAKQAMCGAPHAAPKKKTSTIVKPAKKVEKKAFLIGGEEIIVSGGE